MAALRYLHIIIPQGTEGNPKLESKFEELLINFRNTVKGHRVGFEFFGFAQYTYFFVVVEETLLETMESFIYSTFPEAEIREVEDYTKSFDPSRQKLAGAEITLHHPDVYPIKSYKMFEEDSQSRLFSVISKIAAEEQVWVQIICEPLDDTGGYHFNRRWALRWTDFKHLFSIKDRMREGGRKAINHLRHEKAHEKLKEKPFRMSIRCAYVGISEADAARKLEAVINSFYQFNDSDINEFHGHHVHGISSFLSRYRSRTHADARIYSASELATVYHFPNADYVPHIVHVLARKSDPPQDLPRIGEGGVSGFGVTNYHNNFIPFGIKREDRRRHFYAIGKSGVGKSKLLELLINEDIKNGEGFAVLDPHGDLVDAIMRYIPKERIDDVILFDPADTEFPIAFNPLEKVEDAYKMQVTIGFIDIFKKLFGGN
ncbi:MAG: hypothetical protein RIQ56_835, partial [Candidatus Parcubacteria bacterium]